METYWDTREVLMEHGLIPLELNAKDGLSLINGTSQMVSFLIEVEHILSNLLIYCDLIYCTSLDAF